MPTNVTPQYRSAEQRFKEAVTPEEKIEALEEMIRLLPKHKGTDHLFGQLKKKLSQLKNQGGDKSAGSRVDPFYVPRTGSGQVVLVGMPNTGKSALVAATTKAKVEVADYPFATQLPIPGMLYYADCPIELIDMPPVTADYFPPGMVGTLRNGDLIVVVADAAAEEVLDQVETPLSILLERRVLIEAPPGEDEEEAIPQRTKSPGEVIVALTHCDIEGCGDNVATIRELYGERFTIMEISNETGQGLDALRKLLFDRLDVIRVYTKKPGKDADLKAPFVMKRGSTVTDLARMVHRDLPDTLKSAKLWGSAKFDGQPVKRDHVLEDKDIVELHE
mgnify:CR=1 FL=1